MPAALVTIGVLSLFSPHALELETNEIEIGGERVRLSQPVRLEAAASGLVLCDSGARQWKGTQLTSPGPSFTLTLPGRGFRRSYTGRLRVSVREGRLHPVVAMTLEEAVARAVAAEMPQAPVEARKAQAIAVRSFYRAATRTHTLSDFCDSTHCQLLREEAAREVARGTQGEVLTFQGRILRALYFRSCSGRTLQPDEIRWTLGSDGYPYPPVICESCRRDPTRWQSELPAAAVPVPPSETARLATARRFGWNRLPSNTYQVEHMANGERVRVHGAGEGHGVGLCQRGAIRLARQGLSASQILAHYYPGTTVAQ